MELNQYLDGLRDDLSAAAALGDEETRRAASLLTTALEPATRLMLMAALSDLAGEITTLLHDTSVEVSLHGRDLKVTVSERDDEPEAWPPHAEPDPEPDGTDLGQAVREAGDELSRTTLRLVNRLKSQAERAATIQGVSLNTYIQRAVADAVRSAGRRARRSNFDE
jgi:hypothetical protein